MWSSTKAFKFRPIGSDPVKGIIWGGGLRKAGALQIESPQIAGFPYPKECK